MSFTKRLIEEQEERERAGVALMLKVGAFKRCDVCGDVTDNYGDTEEAAELGESLMAAGDPLVACFDGSKDAMQDALRRAQANTGEECHCAYVAGKDD